MKEYAAERELLAKMWGAVREKDVVTRSSLRSFLLGILNLAVIHAAGSTPNSG